MKHTRSSRAIWLKRTARPFSPISLGAMVPLKPGKTALGNAAEKAETLKTADDAAAFAKAVALYLQNPTTSVDGTGKYTISGLKAGYYLVKDTQAPADDFYSAYIMEVVSNVEAEPKGDKPTVDKNIKDDGETTKVNEASHRRHYQLRSHF